MSGDSRAGLSSVRRTCELRKSFLVLGANSPTQERTISLHLQWDREARRATRGRLRGRLWRSHLPHVRGRRYGHYGGRRRRSPNVPTIRDILPEKRHFWHGASRRRTSTWRWTCGRGVRGRGFTSPRRSHLHYEMDARPAPYLPSFECQFAACYSTRSGDPDR